MRSSFHRIYSLGIEFVALGFPFIISAYAQDLEDMYKDPLRCWDTTDLNFKPQVVIADDKLNFIGEILSEKSKVLWMARWWIDQF